MGGIRASYDRTVGHERSSMGTHRSRSAPKETRVRDHILNNRGVTNMNRNMGKTLSVLTLAIAGAGGLVAASAATPAPAGATDPLAKVTTIQTGSASVAVGTIKGTELAHVDGDQDTHVHHNSARSLRLGMQGARFDV